jgi:hypothetical protein
MSIKTAIVDFGRGLGVLFNKPKDGQGDPKLARMSKIVAAQIPVYGAKAVRDQLIKSIDDDLKRAAKKGPEAVDKLINNAMNTAEYKELLRRTSLNESHIRIMAMEANKKYGKN